MTTAHGMTPQSRFDRTDCTAWCVPFSVDDLHPSAIQGGLRAKSFIPYHPHITTSPRQCRQQIDSQYRMCFRQPCTHGRHRLSRQRIGSHSNGIISLKCVNWPSVASSSRHRQSYEYLGPAYVLVSMMTGAAISARIISAILQPAWTLALSAVLAVSLSGGLLLLIVIRTLLDAIVGREDSIAPGSRPWLLLNLGAGVSESAAAAVAGHSVAMQLTVAAAAGIPAAAAAVSAAPRCILLLAHLAAAVVCWAAATSQPPPPPAPPPRRRPSRRFFALALG